MRIPSVWPSARLLPVTMVGLAALLVVKSAGLVGHAYGAGDAPAAPHAQAEPAEAAHAEAKPAEAPHGEAKPAETKSAESKPAETKNGEPPLPAVAAPEPMPSPTERALLLDLRKRRTELDARATAMEQREALLGAAEKRLAARVDELSVLQKQLEALDAARRDRDEASWRGLVRVYETMKPKDAAAIFEDLDGAVLLQVVDRMKDAKTSAILAAMTPLRARRLTADLSALRGRVNAAPPPTPASPPAADAPPAATPPAATPPPATPSAPKAAAPGAPS